jgi:enoyl-CoA hydratase/carnithine racemase
MAALHLTLDDLVTAARSGGPPPWTAWPPVLVEVELYDADASVAPIPSWWPGVVVGLVDRDSEISDHPTCDVVVTGDDDRAAITEMVAVRPLAATALATLLRAAGHRSVDDGLLTESAVYSALQAGPEFAAWRATRPARDRGDRGARVRVERVDDQLHLTLARPDARNALDTAMRDELVDALALAAADRSITEVHLRGEGHVFCAGGDLDEFGSRPDPATAHVVRLLQSAGRAIDAVGDRVIVHLHGACRGSGVELPAFAGHVVATADTTFGLPEVGLGLIPGAGGTVSLPRRIGRHRTAWLGLSGLAIDASTALDWGLVDEVAT